MSATAFSNSFKDTLTQRARNVVTAITPTSMTARNIASVPASPPAQNLVTNNAVIGISIMAHNWTAVMRGMTSAVTAMTNTSAMVVLLMAIGSRSLPMILKQIS